ncbi:MAG: type 1 glutamine amidotransferase, partial [Rhodospirillales bacterium]|nr:type 1 glutamine amidotransferase [Rhodospirillales bacterium]
VQYHPEFDLFHMARLAVMYSDIMLEGGFHNSLDEIKVHAAMMEDLYNNPSRFDLAWKLGIDKDVLDDEIRTLEISNWVEHLVLPYMATKD